MRLLVVGANGLLGSNVVRAGLDRGWEVSGTYHSTRPAFDVPLAQFDLRNHDAFDDVLDDHEPDVVVNCAAMTDVDRCETNPAQAHLLNGEAPGGMAAHCEASGSAFVHVSTDYVFDGTEPDRYTEADVPNPVQVYGDSKLAGERAVQDELDRALLPRLSFVWGIHRGTDALTGFPAWVRDRLVSGESVPLFTDQRVTPTRAGQAAATILDLVAQGATGCYHLAATSCVTPYEFGTLLAEHLGVGAALLDEGSMADVERAATRPADTCLAVGKVAATLGRSQPTLREDIEAVQDALS